MELDLRPEEDWLHPLEANQYEALYFAFTSPDGRWFGFVRFLLGKEQVLELAALAVEGEFWGMTRAFPRAALRVEGSSLAGPHLRMQMEAGWRRWKVGFDGPLQRTTDGAARPFSMAATFEAESVAARYRLGPYQQGEQEGWMEGELRLGEASGPVRYRFYRDHSWGVRDLGPTPEGWKVATAPGHFYLVYLQMGRPIVFGRVEVDGHPRPIVRAEVEEVEPGLFRYRLPDFDVEATSRRMAAPLDVYLGVGGVEAVRSHPEEGDLFHDKLGPVMYTVKCSHGTEEVPGFLEDARRLA